MSGLGLLLQIIHRGPKGGGGPDPLDQGFSTSGSRPHLGSPSDFRGVARLSTNLLKNDGIFKY